MTKRGLGLVSLYYLYLPLALFLCSWIKFWVGIPLSLLLGIAPIVVLRNIKGNIATAKLSKETIVFCILLAWVILSGIGGYVWQNRWDHFFRNAVFEDLVNRPWPVSDGVNILTYYLGYWLPAAFFAKLTSNIEIGWFVQLLYGFLGILLAFRLTVEKIGNFKLRYLVPFILFSGVDILYFIIFQEPIPRNFHIELWGEVASYESNTTLINWVYNQAIPAWVGTMLILNYGKNLGASALILCFLLISAPFSVVGLFPLALFYIFKDAIDTKSIVGSLKRIFNPINILSSVGAIPVALYFMMNSSTGISFMPLDSNTGNFLISISLLLIFEILVYIPFIYRQIKNSPEFYILLFTCFICLFIQMGPQSKDFNGRVELPLNFFMTLQIAIFIGRWKEVAKICRAIFIVTSMFAVVTPAFEFGRVFYQTLTIPKDEYRSKRVNSVFELETLRGNFVADSVLIKKEPPSGLSLFRYDENRVTKSSGSELKSKKPEDIK